MPDPHPDELAFLAKIADHPDYPLPRLVFADWLEERGDRRAAWVRDDDLWEWMKPDAHDPIPGILVALRVRERFGSDFTDQEIRSKARAALAKLELSAVDAVRAWLQAHSDNWPATEVQQFVGTHPPTKLRSVRALKAKLKEASWVEVWLAIVDLGFHGSAAAPVIPDLTTINGRDRWIEMREGMERSDYPVENAIIRTLGFIGSPDVVPWLASVMWMYQDSVEEALIQLQADADLVVQHMNDEDDHEVEHGISVAAQLTADPVSLLVRVANDKRYTGRQAYAAINLLGEMGAGAAAAIPALAELSQVQDRWDVEYVRETATRALYRIRAEIPPT